MVHLFLIFISCLIIPQVSHPRFFNQIVICPLSCSPSLSLQREQLTTTTFHPHHLQKEGSDSEFVFVFSLFYNSQDFSPPVFSIELLSIRDVTLPPSAHKGNNGCCHCLPIATQNEKAGTVSLFVIIISFSPFPRFLTPIFQLNCYPFMMLHSLPQSTKGAIT